MSGVPRREKKIENRISFPEIPGSLRRGRSTNFKEIRVTHRGLHGFGRPLRAARVDPGKGQRIRRFRNGAGSRQKLRRQLSSSTRWLERFGPRPAARILLSTEANGDGVEIDIFGLESGLCSRSLNFFFSPCALRLPWFCRALCERDSTGTRRFSFLMACPVQRHVSLKIAPLRHADGRHLNSGDANLREDPTTWTPSELSEK